MGMVGLDSTSLQMDSQSKSIGLVWSLKVGSCLALFYINEMNQVISYWLCRD